MKTDLLCALALSLSGLCIANASGQSSSPDPQQTTSPRLLLQEADGLSQHFSPEERADVLLALAKAAAGSISQEDSQTWAKELFQTSFLLQMGQNRSAAQKNALVVLAQTNPGEAAELFKSQDLPPRPLLREDIRTFGTRLIFPALEKKGGEKALAQIADLCDWLGSTGQYPYVAIAPIIVETAKNRPDDADQIFTDAVSFVSRDPGFETTNADVVKLLVATQKAVSLSALRYGVQQVLWSIERAKADKSRSRLQFEVKTDKAAVHFDSESEYLVYRLLPVVRSIDSRWAVQIEEKYRQ